MPPDKALSFAFTLADLADAITLPSFRGDLDIRTKSDGSIVTQIDALVESTLRSRIREIFPSHSIHGEEQGAETRNPEGHWILDPIDGTIAFASGLPVWATLIAFECSGEVVAGCVSAPAMQQRWWASSGSGASCHRGPLRVGSATTISQSAITYGTFGLFEGDHQHGLTAILGSCKHSRGYGDFWGHMLVAEGVFDAMIDPIVSVWDVAPLRLIVNEAGGEFTDFSGTSSHEVTSALSSNGLIHQEILSNLATVT